MFGKKYELKTKIKVLAILKKTSAKFWNTVEPGDEYTLVYVLEHRPGFKADYQPKIHVYQNGRKIFEDSANRLLGNMENFEIEELK